MKCDWCRRSILEPEFKWYEGVRCRVCRLCWYNRDRKKKHRHSWHAHPTFRKDWVMMCTICGITKAVKQ